MKTTINKLADMLLTANEQYETNGTYGITDLQDEILAIKLSLIDEHRITISIQVIRDILETHTLILNNEIEGIGDYINEYKLSDNEFIKECGLLLEIDNKFINIFKPADK